MKNTPTEESCIEDELDEIEELMVEALGSDDSPISSWRPIL